MILKVAPSVPTTMLCMAFQVTYVKGMFSPSCSLSGEAPSIQPYGTTTAVVFDMIVMSLFTDAIAVISSSSSSGSNGNSPSGTMNITLTGSIGSGSGTGSGGGIADMPVTWVVQPLSTSPSSEPVATAAASASGVPVPPRAPEQTRWSSGGSGDRSERGRRLDVMPDRVRGVEHFVRG